MIRLHQFSCLQVSHQMAELAAQLLTKAKQLNQARIDAALPAHVRAACDALTQLSTPPGPDGLDTPSCAENRNDQFTDPICALLESLCANAYLSVSSSECLGADDRAGSPPVPQSGPQVTSWPTIVRRYVSNMVVDSLSANPTLAECYLSRHTDAIASLSTMPPDRIKLHSPLLRQFALSPRCAEQMVAHLSSLVAEIDSCVTAQEGRASNQVRVDEAEVRGRCDDAASEPGPSDDSDRMHHTLIRVLRALESIHYLVELYGKEGRTKQQSASSQLGMSC